MTAAVLAACLWLPLPRAVAQETEGDAPAAEMPQPAIDEQVVQRAIEAGEIEFALRLVRGGRLLVEPDERILDLYRQALKRRLRDADQGAVVQLILDAPPGAEADRVEAARQLARLWRDDLAPTRRRLERRLQWYTEIQQAVQPGPLDVELPVTLTLLTLDRVDRLLEPEESLALLAIGERWSPNNLVWSSYRPSDTEVLEIAESLAAKQRLLAAMELYRQLIHRAPQQREWFRRRLARTQVTRVLDRAACAGVEAGLYAATNVRREFLSDEEKARLRALELNMRQMVADYDQTRTLPMNIRGEMSLDRIPVSYDIRDETYVGQGGVLRFGPGSILSGGHLYLEGGEVRFEGTRDRPVTVIGVRFHSNDFKGGGKIFGNYVRFRECRWDRGRFEALPGGMQWNITNSFSWGCRWMFDASAWVTWTGSEFRESRFHLATVRAAGDPEPVQPVSWSASSQRGIEGSVFFDCEIDDVLAVTASDCSFIDCHLIAFAAREHKMNSATLVNANYFEPRGEIPYLVNQIARFSPGGGPYVFQQAPSGPVVDLGLADTWVD